MNLIDKIDRKLEGFINSQYAKKLLDVVKPKMSQYSVAPLFLYSLYEGFIEETKDTVTVVIEANLTLWIDPDLIEDEDKYHKMLEQGVFLSILVDVTVPKNIKLLTQDEFNKKVYSMLLKLLKPRVNGLDEVLRGFDNIPERKPILPLAIKSYRRLQAVK